MQKDESKLKEEIHSTLVNRSGQTLAVVYQDIDAIAEIGGREVSGVHAYCFLGDKLIIVYAEEKKYWTPPGGGVEPSETVEEAVVREVLEETNMRVLKQKLIGFQDISEPHRIATQTRSVCIVEPIGEFVSDPDGDITEIKLIDPSDIKRYFDWGEIGEHILERALMLKEIF
ncbi:MAG: NUDIX hydrolase [Candidatus Kaiserbacteria bacterium]|nr:NUDIX hydrolase [Candidatus Kaiserbacteria bacterium]